MIGISLIAKAVLKLIMPDVTEQLLRVFKLDKVVDYMELPNEADIKIGKLEEKENMMTENLKNLENMFDKVKKLRDL